MPPVVLGIFAVMAMIFGLFVIYAIMVYNGLIRSRNIFKNAYSQIDVQLKRRYDLIPNLVETAKAYMAHEKQTLEAVIAARNTAYTASQKASAQPDNPEAMKNLMAAEAGLTGALSKLMVVSEAYPELKANSTMNSLMEELTSTENKISFARQAFNDSVTEYNNQRESFPTNIIAGMFNFQGASLFEIDRAEERQTVKVQF